jgi:DNA modification methylase
MLELNKVYQGDCLEVMKEIDDGSVDMVLTSPPYDNLRTYNDSLEWGERIWKPVIQELYRIVKNGGVVVWVVGDATIKGSETGTSFKQALYFKEVGFNLHDTMIYRKQNPMPIKAKRYSSAFEYMFVCGKGNISTFNPILVKSTYAGEKLYGKRTTWRKDGTKNIGEKSEIANHKIPENIFTYLVGSFGTNKSDHPATFPEKLAHDHIISWSNEGDTILDPFAGSGTTGKVAKQLKRNFILIEKEPEYVEICRKRIENVQQHLF